jgi:hypothetical protein
MPIDLSEKGRLAVDADVLVRAFEGAPKELALDRKNSEALVVAEHIITFAKAGERDPVRLCDLAVKAVRQNRSASE